MRVKEIGLALFGMVLLVSHQADAGTITIDGVLQTVHAEAQGDTFDVRDESNLSPPLVGSLEVVVEVDLTPPPVVDGPAIPVQPIFVLARQNFVTKELSSSTIDIVGGLDTNVTMGFIAEMFGGDALTVSRFGLDFSIDSPFNYVIGGYVPDDAAVRSITLWRDGSDDIFRLVNGELGNAEGVLAPGSYHFLASAQADTDSAGNVFFNFSLNSPVSEVPEPSSIVLLLTGAIGFVGYHWRRRRQVTA